MARRKLRKSGGGAASTNSNPWLGFMVIIFGTVAMSICLIMFNIGIGQLDTAYTAAATYTEQVGLTDIMGIWGLVIFLIFASAGVAALGAGGYMQVRKAITGGWMDIFIVAISGGVSLVIALIMNGIIQGQLHTAYTTANACTNVASFSGLLDIMTVWGMVIFLSLMAAGIAQLAGSAWGSYKHLAGRL